MAAKKNLNEDYKSDGKWKEIWRRFKKNKGAVIGLVLLVVLTVILVGAPLFISYDKAITQNMDLMLAKPSVGNLFGNDGYGRDIFARIIYGGRVSIAIAILATISSCLFGSLLGAVAGYFGGKVDSIIMRSLDIFMSVPDILFTMAVVYALGASFTNLIIALVISYITLYKTRFGLRLMACGEHPQAAASVGINVYKMRWAGVLISGLLGGLGGIVYITCGVSEWKFEYGVAGFGFLSLAVMIFGQWKPTRIALAALLFGLFRALSNVYFGFSFLVSLNIPSGVYNMLPYVISLIVLAFTSKNSRAPKAEGIPYDKGQR